MSRPGVHRSAGPERRAIRCHSQTPGPVAHSPGPQPAEPRAHGRDTPRVRGGREGAGGTHDRRATGSGVTEAVVAVGASAGGVEALRTVIGGFPPDLPAAVTVVPHVPPSGESALPAILRRSTPLPVAHAKDDEDLVAGHVYIAPPDCHLLVQPGRVRVVRGPKENGMRPAIDPLFRSAAMSYGPRTIGVVLSGALADGAAGAYAIDRMGGSVIVQSPEDAGFPDMPLATIAADHPDRVLAAAEIGAAVGAILLEHLSDGAGMEERADQMVIETSYAALDPEIVGRDGALTPF